MNAFTPVTPSTYGFSVPQRVALAPTDPSRVPVFHGRVFAGFVDGIDGAAGAPGASNHPALPGDGWILAQITASLRTEPWLDAASIDVSVRDGVVRLLGQIDSLHGSLAARRIAAMTPGVTTVVDDLWITCE